MRKTYVSSSGEIASRGPLCLSRSTSLRSARRPGTRGRLVWSSGDEGVVDAMTGGRALRRGRDRHGRALRRSPRRVSRRRTAARGRRSAPSPGSDACPLRDAGFRPSSGRVRGDGCGNSHDARVLPTPHPAGVLPIWRWPSRPAPNREWMLRGSEESHDQK